MGEYYYKKINNEEHMVLLGFQSVDGNTQEAWISLRYGANLCRYAYQGFNIIDYDPALWGTSEFTGTPVLYPTPNRVENGTFIFRGKTYDQVKRGKRIFEHGLVFDEEWELLEVYATDKEAFLSARLLWTEDSPLFKAFPFRHSLTLRFSLTDGAVEISFEIANHDIKDIPFGFGLHPYFQKLSGEDRTSIELPVDNVMEASEALLPTGRIMAVQGTKFDLNQPTSIGSLDLDHVFIRSAGDDPATIHYADQGFGVYIYATDDFSHYVVYSPPGMPYFCIENQTCSTDAHNLYNRGLHEISGLKIVTAGEHKTGRVRYKIFPE
jgi:aldose 1-epimerase